MERLEIAEKIRELKTVYISLKKPFPLAYSKYLVEVTGRDEISDERIQFIKNEIYKDETRRDDFAPEKAMMVLFHDYCARKKMKDIPSLQDVLESTPRRRGEILSLLTLKILEG